MQLKKLLEEDIENVALASSEVEETLARTMFDQHVREARNLGFNIGFQMNRDLNKIEAVLLPFRSRAEHADGWILSEWDELALKEMHVTWNAA